MSERLSMRKIREVLRLKFQQALGHRQIAASCGIGAATVSDYLRRARAANVGWVEAQPLSDAELEARLFPQPQYSPVLERAPVDFGWVHRELRRSGVTLQLLWSEYVEGARGRCAAEPYQYSQFCARYHDYRSKLDLVMRQVHRAGDKAFIDYSGKKPVVIDAATGEVHEVELFVMVLGASNYTFAEATPSQKLSDFTGSITRALEFFGGVPNVLVPDQLRSAVRGPDRYDPDINATLLELAKHYGTTIIPARPRKPRDKAKVETAVLIVQRWILARLRHQRFYSLEELNLAIAELVVELNERPFRKLEGSRRSAFEAIDRPALMPLPAQRFQNFEWAKARVHVDYHVAFDHRFYSVPHSLVGERVEVRATELTVEIFHGDQRVFSHRRSYGPKGTMVSCEHHRPESHRDYGKWPPERLVAWASKLGPNVARVAEMTLASYPRPEMGYRPVLGIIRTGERFGAARFDAACARALAVSGSTAPRRKFIEALLKQRLEVVPLAVGETVRPLGHHDNVRGGAYFTKETKHAD
ncbi:MAG TPA: IS21 family transposase [Steroidobacteraceae bacterium]|nr:IS21 family transposase [Steroidobacteraceae bacterium]